MNTKILNKIEKSKYKNGSTEYTKEFKAELDKRYAYYKNGGKMVSATEVKIQIEELLQKIKRH